MRKILLLLFFVSSCATRSHPDRHVSSEGQIGRVVLIGIDGLIGQYIEKGDIPNIRKLMAEGSYTLKMINEIPNESATNWFSMFSSTDSSLHGILDSNGTPQNQDQFTTIFKAIKSQSPEEKVIAIFNRDEIAPLILEDEIQIIDKNNKKAAEVEAAAIETIKKVKPLFSFIYFGDVEKSGQKDGWGGKKYFQALHEVDASIGKIISSLKEEGILDETLIVITSGHGGKEKGHRPEPSIYREIPFIVLGPNIKSGNIIGENLRIIDIIPTIAAAINLAPSWYWNGKVTNQIFKDIPKASPSFPPVVEPHFSKMTAGLKWGKNAYVFQEKDFSRFNLVSGEEEITNRSNWNFYGLEKFNDGPENIDAALNWGNGTAYFFKGKEFIEVELKTNRPSMVKKINKKNWPGLENFSKIDAAENFDQGLAYFFSGNQFVVYDVRRKEPQNGYPRNIRTEDFPGLEKFTGGASDFDAVINWGNGKVYFLKGNEYIRFDIKSFKADEGFPKTLN
jgi:hypothetical protein